MKDPIKIGDKIWHFDGALLREGIVTSVMHLPSTVVNFCHSQGTALGLRSWNTFTNSVSSISSVYLRPSETSALLEAIESSMDDLKRISNRIAREYEHEAETVQLDESPAIAALPVTDKIQPLVGCH